MEHEGKEEQNGFMKPKLYVDKQCCKKMMHEEKEYEPPSVFHETVRSRAKYETTDKMHC